MKNLFFNSCNNYVNDDMTDASALVRELVRFSDELGLSGNVWQQWLTYVLITDENPFTLTCERRSISEDSTLMQLAYPDIDRFRQLFDLKGSKDLKGRKAGDQSGDGCPVPADDERIAYFTDYKSPYAGTDGDQTETDAGRRIRELSEKLSAAGDPEGFTRVLTDFYEKRGAGIYGLYNAFRAAQAAGRAADRAAAGVKASREAAATSCEYKDAAAAAGVRTVPVTDAGDVSFDDLVGYEEHKKILKENTEAFLRGGGANNVLLYGDSGTGKSTSVRALMHDYADEGLRIIEIGKRERHLLPQVLAEVKKRNYRFIIFLDDLSFEEDESDYKELKAMLEGALESRGDRVLIYATSNRRHLIRETWSDRTDMRHEDDVHRSDTLEEKLSLAERFGITISYAKPNYRGYMQIVKTLAERAGIDIGDDELADEARKWSLRHGSTSGRTAAQLVTWLSGTAGR